MNTTFRSLLVLSVMAATSASASWRPKYRVVKIERSRILIDRKYDAYPDARAAAFIMPYKSEVDRGMSPVVGTTAHPMASHRPESDLSNLLSDILVWAGGVYHETPDFGIYNVGGIRASLPSGTVTYGDVLNVAPFENHICFLTLSGDKVLQLFREIAARGGEGVSHSVKMVITGGHQLKTVTVNGEPVDPQKSYRVVTLDYLSQGNDGMSAFKAKTSVVSPTENTDNVRYIIVDYFKKLMAEGKAVDAKVEGRITVGE